MLNAKHHTTHNPTQSSVNLFERYPSIGTAGVMTMDDSKLRQDVLDELDWQPHIPSAQIAVTADQGIVRLSGHVSTYAEKVAAEQAVKRVVGVRAAVLESLEVRVADEIADADEEVGMRARTSIGWAALVPSGRVEVSVANRWVTLSGQLDWHFQRAAAEQRRSGRPLHPRQGCRWFGDTRGRGGVVVRPGTRQRRGMDGTGRKRSPRLIDCRVKAPCRNGLSACSASLGVTAMSPDVRYLGYVLRVGVETLY